MQVLNKFEFSGFSTWYTTSPHMHATSLCQPLVATDGSSRLSCNNCPGEYSYQQVCVLMDALLRCPVHQPNHHTGQCGEHIPWNSWLEFLHTEAQHFDVDLSRLLERRNLFSNVLQISMCVEPLQMGVAASCSYTIKSLYVSECNILGAMNNLW